MSMYRHSNYQPGKATLYLIPTPIGNLEDITLRALRILKEVDAVYAEDTRNTMKLLNHYKISGELKSLHEHNEKEVTPDIIDRLERGENIGIVSDAGMPLFSDPGYGLVQKAMEAGYNVVCLPGANAATTGLLMSGINPQPFTFVGFLDTRKSKRKARLEELRFRKETLVFYEAPHRIKAMLADLAETYPDRMVCVCREISKKFEEIVRGTAEELSQIEDWKGEMVVVMKGSSDDDSTVDKDTYCQQVDALVKAGTRLSEAAKKVSETTGVSKNVIYQEYLAKTKKQ